MSGPENRIFFANADTYINDKSATVRKMFIVRTYLRENIFYLLCLGVRQRNRFVCRLCCFVKALVEKFSFPSIKFELCVPILVIVKVPEGVWVVVVVNVIKLAG